MHVSKFEAHTSSAAKAAKLLCTTQKGDEIMDIKRLDFFLGALTPTGFAGYYSQLVQDTASHVVLIKGCPGTGKSTLIKRLADYLCKKGEKVELIHCAQDPSSYDGLVCKNIKFTITDATPPHTLEPMYPVAYEQVLPLYYCIDADALQQHRNEIIELFDRHAFLTERTTRYLAAAGSLLQDTVRTAQAFTNTTKACDFAKVLSKKYIPDNDNEKDNLNQQPKNASYAFVKYQNKKTGAKEDVRILSAVTHSGVQCYEETILKLANNIIAIEDLHGYAAKCMLYVLRQEALAKGHGIITCYCSMSPYDKIEHIIIPKLNLAFVTCNTYHCSYFLTGKTKSNANIRRIHTTRFCNKEGMNLRKKRFRFNNKATKQLILQAQQLMGQIKQCHEKIESYYVKSADFPALDRAYNKIVEQIKLGT